MYYNRMLRVWVFDQLDYFLISALIGSLIASHLKEHLSEKLAMERLKKSIISKSALVVSKSKPPILKSKKAEVKKIYKFALENRGGQGQSYKLAKQIEQVVKRLAEFLKRRELKGMLKIFFKNGRLILDLILCACDIDIKYFTYYIISSEGLSPHVIAITLTTGGTIGFILSWYLAGFALFVQPLITSVFLLRGLTQQILNQMEFAQFKKMLNKVLDDDDIKERLQVIFLEGEAPAHSFDLPKLEPSGLDQNPILQHDFNLKSGEDIETFLENNYGLTKNPTAPQIEKILKGKRPKPKSKMVKFSEKVAEEWANDNANSDIIEPEIIEKKVREAIRIRRDDEL